MNNRYDIEFAKYEFAKYSFMECQKFLNLYEELNELAASKLSFSTMVSTAFVITYSRVFSNSNKEYHGFKMGAISKKWLNNLNDRHKEAHEYLLGSGRNSLAAHIDLGKLMPNIFVKDGGNVDFVFDMHLPMINHNTINVYKELLLVALNYCREHQQGLIPNLSGNHLVPEVSCPEVGPFIDRSTKKK